MKVFQSWTQQFQQWRHPYSPKCHNLTSKDLNSPAAVPRKQPRKRRNASPAMLVFAAVSITGVAGHRFYNQPKLDVGTKAPETITAPHDVRVEDSKTTEEKRKAVSRQQVPVWMMDKAVNEQIDRDLQKTIAQGEELRSQLNAVPFINTSVLSTTNQEYLRQAEQWEWRLVLSTVDNMSDVNPTSSTFSLADVTREGLNPAFAQTVTQLLAYRRRSSPEAFTSLIEQITQHRQAYISAVGKLSERTEQLGSPYNASLLTLSNEDWQRMQMGIREAATRITTQGIPPGLPPQILEEAIKIQVQGQVPKGTESVATKILLGVLRTNLTKDEEETQLQAEQAAQQVGAIIVVARQGDVIVSAGEEITQDKFVLLDRFGLSRRSINWLGLVGFGGVVAGAVGTFWLVEHRFYSRNAGVVRHLRRRDYLLVLLLSLSTPLLGTFGAAYTNLPAIGWLVGSFYGPTLGVTAVGLLTGLVTISIGGGWEYLVAGAAGGLLAAMMAGRMRSREELALVGSGVGVTQGAVYLLSNFILSAVTGSIGYNLLQEAAVYGLHGLGWSILALGISPYLEHLFDLVTPIRLAELSNPNRPLLKRLASQTPGTFQHTLFVANLAEAAARTLNCNVELVRAGTLYHDIGKMHDPLGFIENQMGGPNKHDEINDPWKSAEIIKKHVTEGLVMARKHRLPKAIQAFIPEHQGTILIAYFYHQAQKLAEQDPTIVAREEDFRYAGPVPQSRETAIVMVADACEAALRSIKEATPETALTMINKILRARWQDNQLVDSGLTREDLSKIAEVFVKVWQESNHQRIAYPKETFQPQKC